MSDDAASKCGATVFVNKVDVHNPRIVIHTSDLRTTHAERPRGGASVYVQDIDVSGSGGMWDVTVEVNAGVYDPEIRPLEVTVCLHAGDPNNPSDTQTQNNPTVDHLTFSFQGIASGNTFTRARVTARYEVEVNGNQYETDLIHDVHRGMYGA